MAPFSANAMILDGYSAQTRILYSHNVKKRGLEVYSLIGVDMGLCIQHAVLQAHIRSMVEVIIAASVAPD